MHQNDYAVIGTPYEYYDQLGYSLKVVNGYPYPYVAGKANLGHHPQHPSTTSGCYQVMTPHGEILLKSWVPTYYNPPLSYNRCAVPRSFGPDYGSASSCGCGGGAGPRNQTTNGYIPNQRSVSGPCACYHPSPRAWEEADKKKVRPFREGFFGYRGQADSPIGPEWKSTRRIYQSGYQPPEVVYGPRRQSRYVKKNKSVGGCSTDGCLGDTCNFYAHPRPAQNYQRIQSMPLREAAYNWYTRPYSLLVPGMPDVNESGAHETQLTKEFREKMDNLSATRDCKRCYQGQFNPFGRIE